MYLKFRGWGVGGGGQGTELVKPQVAQARGVSMMLQCEHHVTFVQQCKLYGFV